MPEAASVWPMLVLIEPIRSGSLPPRTAVHHGAQRFDLDGIAEGRAGAVGLDIVEGVKFERRVLERPADHGLLSGAVGDRQAA